MALLPSPKYDKCCDITPTEMVLSDVSLFRLKPRFTFPETFPDIPEDKLRVVSSIVVKGEPGFTRIP